MASFSGSKSDVVGSGLAAPCECLEDPDELRVLFISLDISRINSARCCELVVAAIVALLLRSAKNSRSRTRVMSKKLEALFGSQSRAFSCPELDRQTNMLLLMQC